MKRIHLLPEEGEFYKANLHCHTTVSDGRLTPKQCRDLYRRAGYSILAVTDHNQYQWHRELSGEDFLVLAACEMDINDDFIPGDFSLARTYHLNLYDLEPWNQEEVKKTAVYPNTGYEDRKGINRYIFEMNRLGFLVSYNHPYWSLQNYEDYKGLEGLFALEVYNHSCELDGMYGYQPQVYDEILRLDKHIFCLASDDNHNQYEEGHPLWDSFGGFTMIRAEGLAYRQVAQALEKGSFYCSFGPEIKELYLEEDMLHVKCSPAEKIYMHTEGRRCEKAAAGAGKPLEEAVFPIKGNEGYIRVDIKDEKGRHALSNAYFI